MQKQGLFSDNLQFIYLSDCSTEYLTDCSTDAKVKRSLGREILFWQSTVHRYLSACATDAKATRCLGKKFLSFNLQYIFQMHQNVTWYEHWEFHLFVFWPNKIINNSKHLAIVVVGCFETAGRQKTKFSADNTVQKSNFFALSLLYLRVFDVQYCICTV